MGDGRAETRPAAATPRAAGRRLLLLTRLPPPYGGLTVHSERLAAAAARRGWRVTVMTPPAPPDPAPRPFRRVRLAARQLAWLARLRSASCDVLHDHISTYAIGARDPQAIALQLGLLAALRLNGAPWILSCGNGLLPGLLSATSPRLRSVYCRLYTGVRAAIAKNQPILEAFAELGLADRSRVVGTFLEPRAPSPTAPLAPEVESFLRAHPACVATAGFRFEPLYHVDAVVRAAAAVRRLRPPDAPQVGVVVFGSHHEDPEGKAALDAAVAETGMEPHVLVLRDVDDALQVMARAAVLVRASDFDGDANTVKEAMLVGVPVLATDLPGRPPGVGLVAKGDFRALGEKLRHTLESPDADRIERNRAFVRSDIERNEAAIFALYEEASA